MTLTLKMVWSDGDRQYRHSRPLHVFSRDPLAGQQKFLQEANISLFDPESKTSDLFERHGIPCRLLPNLASVDSVEGGVLVVGEGISFDSQRMLAESLLLAAHRGVSVLCLAPGEGEFRLVVDKDGEVLRPDRLVLQRRGVVRLYDKRFDELVNVSHLSLTSRRNEIVLEVGNPEDDWSWLCLEFSGLPPEKPSGRVILCGLGVVSHWEASPVPRYLLAHLLHELGCRNSIPEEPTNDNPTQ